MKAIKIKFEKTVDDMLKNYVVKKINRSIKKIRLNHNLSQAQLAKQLGVSRQAVQKWETGKNKISLSRVLLLHEKYPNEVF